MRNAMEDTANTATPGLKERTVEDISPGLKNNARKLTRGKHGGRRSGAGRKKGVPNKLTADVKAAIMEAFCEAGGAEYLRKISKTHPQVFCTLIGKILPQQT